jgi:hypothetical protein
MRIGRRQRRCRRGHHLDWPATAGELDSDLVAAAAIPWTRRSHLPTNAEEVATTDAVVPEDRNALLGPDEFHSSHSLEQLLVGAEPIASIDELAIPELSEDESEAFLEAIGS